MLCMSHCRAQYYIGILLQLCQLLSDVGLDRQQGRLRVQHLHLQMLLCVLAKERKGTR